MQKRAACFGGTKSPSNRGENQSLDHSQPLLTVSGHEFHFLIRKQIAIFEVRRWIAVNYPAPCRRIVSSARRTRTRPLIVANDT